MYKILVINMGSTSSKLAYFEDDICKIKENIEHPAGKIKEFANVLDQYEYRREIVLDFMLRHGIDGKSLDAIASRGGHTHPIEGGTYKINDRMIDEIRTGDYGRHACDLGVFIAKNLAEAFDAVPLVTDPPVTDEFEISARYSGLPGLPRKSSFHALNQRAAAKQYAKDVKKAYEDLNLIDVHMGGGVSVVAHKQGKMVDGNNALDGEGPFSTNRTGTLPVGALVKLCFSGEYTFEQVKKMINGSGGMMAYIGETDFKIVQEGALDGNTAYKECMDAMLYQICKEIGSAAPVLKGRVDAIVLTGGIAYSVYVADYIKEHCGFIAPIVVYPGEFEMDALANGACEVLRGEKSAKEI